MSLLIFLKINKFFVYVKEVQCFSGHFDVKNYTYNLIRLWVIEVTEVLNLEKETDGVKTNFFSYIYYYSFSNVNV